MKGEADVTSIASALELAVPTVSNILARMERLGLVERKRRGRRVFVKPSAQPPPERDAFAN